MQTTTEAILNSEPPATPEAVSRASEETPQSELLAAPKPDDGGHTTHSKRRNGHVARLPKEVRQRINEMLDDGLPYERILKKLGAKGRGLDTSHIGSWRKGGYQDYLNEERRLGECRLRHDLIKRLATDHPGIEAYQASPKISVALACETLLDLGPETLRRALQENPMNAFRLLNAMARTVSGGLKCERHIADQAAHQASAEKESQPDSEKGLSKKTFKEMNAALKLM
jgi:hypothetical protein